MTDYTDLQKAAEYAAQDTIKFADESEEMRALQQFHEEVNPETVLALIAENQALKGPHDWLAEDLIKELVDNAQAIQENADDGEEDQFVIVLLAAAQRIRRQEANIEKLKADVVLFAKAADCWDRLNIQNKALSDSFRAERDRLKAENEALMTQLPEPYAVVGDYAACGGGRLVWDVEYAEKIDDRMCAKTPVYDRASLEAAGVRVKP